MEQKNLRPKTFEDYIGQAEVKQYLTIKVNAFNKTGKAPGHMLLLGPSGIGKTTLAAILANEMGVNYHQISATRVRKWDDILSILSKIKENDIFFIDEIHALNSTMQEELYGVMEDFKYTMYFKATDEHVTYDIPRFTLIGATTHVGELNGPLINRFQYKPELVPYTVDDLTIICQTAAKRNYDMNLSDEIAKKIAQLSLRNARQCYSLLFNYIEYVEGTVDGELYEEDFNTDSFSEFLKLMHIDPMIGLDRSQRKYLVLLLREKTAIGLNTLANLLNDREQNITSKVEPFIMSDVEFVADMGSHTENIYSPLVKITKKGRMATNTADIYMQICKRLQKDGYFVGENLTY